MPAYPHPPWSSDSLSPGYVNYGVWLTLARKAVIWGFLCGDGVELAGQWQLSFTNRSKRDYLHNLTDSVVDAGADLEMRFPTTPVADGESSTYTSTSPISLIVLTTDLILEDALAGMTVVVDSSPTASANFVEILSNSPSGGVSTTLELKDPLPNGAACKQHDR